MNKDETLTVEETEKRIDKAVEAGACDHAVGVCWGKPLVKEADHDEDEKFFVNARKRRRIAAKDRLTRRRKGQRAFNRQQRQRRYEQDTIAMQLHVLRTRPADDPMYRNVYNGLVAKYGNEIKVMIAAEQTGVIA